MPEQTTVEGDTMTLGRRAFMKTGLAAIAAGRMSGVGFAGDDTPSPLVNRDIGAASKAARLSMLFRGSTPTEFSDWQRAFRKQLVKLLGDFETPKKWKAVEEGRREHETYTRIDLLLQAEGVPALPVYLLVPKTATAERPRPGVLCVHGHGAYGNHPVVGRTDLPGVADAIRGAHYDYGLQLVRRGYVVAAPCMIPFGRRVDRDKYAGQDPCAVNFVRMQALGLLPLTANLSDLRWSIDLLESRPEVKKGGVGCVGLSYGGRMTMMVSAMDERIKVAAISGALNLLQERITHRYSCGSQIIPGLLKYGDYSEIGSLIAPRTCVWEAGSTDGLIVPGWADLFKKRLQRAYQAAGAADKLHFDHFEGGHRWNGEVAYPLLDSVLRATQS